MPKAKITQTSRDTAEVEPIVIRPGKTTRIVFKPQIVNNANDENRPVRGSLLWQKRGPSEQDDDWVDESELDLRTMHAGCGIKLELKTEELYLLTQAVRGLYGVYWNHGKQLPKTGDEFELADYAQAAKSLDALGEAANLINTMGADGFVSLLQLLAKQDNAAKVLEASKRLDLTDLAEINAIAGVGILRQVLEVWEANRTNGSEDFWQDTLSRYSFVFSQLFSTPVVVFREKAYVGGKDVSGKGGKSPDYLLKNELTTHILIVELKTPKTPLLGKTPYREPDIYAMDRELSGAIAQIGKYKDDFLKNCHALQAQTAEPFRAVDPRCLIVAGCTDQLETPAMKDSFEYVRRGQRSTEIITFDELFRKVKMLLQLLEGKLPCP